MLASGALVYHHVTMLFTLTRPEGLEPPTF